MSPWKVEPFFENHTAYARAYLIICFSKNGVGDVFVPNYDEEKSCRYNCLASVSGLFLVLYGQHGEVVALLSSAGKEVDGSSHALDKLHGLVLSLC